MHRKAHWTQRLERGVMFVPMPVKTLRGVGGLPFCQEERLLVAYLRECRSPLWVILRADLLKVGCEELLDLRVVFKVDGFHFTSKAPFVVVWGRNSFAWTYEGNHLEACRSIEQTQYLALGANRTVRTWLAAVEAEIHAHLSDREACLKALRDAEHVEDQQDHLRESYWIYFDPSLLAGYQGASLLKLSNQGHHHLIQTAQTALHQALDLLDPSMKRRQPTLLIDLAGTYVHQKQIEHACACALQATDLAAHLHSPVVLQRLLSLRTTLEPWKDTSAVQELDQSLAPLLLTGRRAQQESA